MAVSRLSFVECLEPNSRFVDSGVVTLQVRANALLFVHKARVPVRGLREIRPQGSINNSKVAGSLLIVTGDYAETNRLINADFCFRNQYLTEIEEAFSSGIAYFDHGQDRAGRLNLDNTVARFDVRREFASDFRIPFDEYSRSPSPRHVAFPFTTSDYVRFLRLFG